MSIKPSGPAYEVGDNPDYSLDVSSIVKDDYVVDELMNYLMLRILQNIEHVRLKVNQRIIIGPDKPDGPALWLDTGKSYEDETVGKDVVFQLGEPGGDAQVYTEVDGTTYPVTNATGTMTENGYEVTIDAE